MAPRPLFVLFVSTGNAARSLMAEAILNAKGSDSFRARSAGTAPRTDVPPETKAFLEMAGYETARLHPKPWEDFLAAASFVKVDIIVTLSEEARELCHANWPNDPVRVHWTLDDPLGADRPDIREWKFRKCLSTLEARISTLVRTRLGSNKGEIFMNLKEIGMVTG